MLRRRHQPQTQTSGKAKGRQEAHEASGPRGHTAGSIPCGVEGWGYRAGRLGKAVAFGRSVGRRFGAAAGLSPGALQPKTCPKLAAVPTDSPALTPSEQHTP